MDPQAPTFNIAPSPVDPLVAPEIPKEPKDNHWITILAMALFVLGSLAVVAFLYYQNQQLKSMLASYQPNPTSLPTTSSDPTAGWKTYTNSKFGYSVKYQPELTPRNVSSPDYADITSFDPDSKMSIAISTKTLNKAVDFEKLALGHVAATLSAELKTNFGDSSAVRLDWKANDKSVSDQSQILISNGKYTYILRAESRVFDQILSTFQFTK